MRKIRLTIDDIEENPNFKPLEEEYPRYYQDRRSPDEKWDRKVARRLEVEITDDEWQAVKRAVLEAM